MPPDLHLDHFLEPSQWQTRVAEHRAAMATWTEPFRRRRKEAKTHPIHDFLFVYYRFPPSKLKQWHPALGTGLLLSQQTPVPEWFSEDRYTIAENSDPASKDMFPKTCFATPEKIKPKERDRLSFILTLLEQTQNRHPQFGCFGLHEWAMVYRGQEVRHEATTPLRLSQAVIDKVVESRPIVCSHFDAFRFFAIDAKPLNRIQPTLDGRIDQEQPGCIHANMDLYKWAFKAMPWVGSERLKECFELAMEAREIDMRASPYDLSDYGAYAPILIETSEGRTEYERAQRRLFEKSQVVRGRLISAIQCVLAKTPESTSR